MSSMQEKSHDSSGDEKTQTFLAKLIPIFTQQPMQTSLDRFYVCTLEIYLYEEVKKKKF